MSEKKLASDYFMEGLNCAESVIKAYNEEFGTDIPIRVASGLVYVQVLQKVEMI